MSKNKLNIDQNMLKSKDSLIYGEIMIGPEHFQKKLISH